FGYYFDPSNPSLPQTVRSLNATELVYPPESRIKYSNAAIATVGFVLEHTQKEPFAKYLKRAVLEPLGLKRSSFEPDPGLTRDLAKAYMWTYWGRVFEAPTFSLGMAPAGSMYSTVTDLGRFLSVLFAGGKGPQGPVRKPSGGEIRQRRQGSRPDRACREAVCLAVARRISRRATLAGQHRDHGRSAGVWPEARAAGRSDHCWEGHV